MTIARRTSRNLKCSLWTSFVASKTQPHKNFTKIWSKRYTSRMKLNGQVGLVACFPYSTVSPWISEIQSVPGDVWYRMVYYRWKDLPLEDHKPIVKWMSAVCAHPCFVRNRAWNHFSTGYQLWFSHEDDVMLAKLGLQDPVIQIRQFTTTQLCEDMLMHFCNSVMP